MIIDSVVLKVLPIAIKQEKKLWSAVVKEKMKTLLFADNMTTYEQVKIIN